MSTSGDVQYIRGDIMSISGGYHDTCGDTMSTSGMFSTLGCTMSTSRGYHEYIRGCSVHWDFQQKLKGFYQLAPPHAS